MKIHLYTTLPLLLTLSLHSCNTAAKKKKSYIEQEWNKYRRAIEVKDYNVAKNYVYNIIEVDSNNHIYYDTLAKLYFITKDYKSALEASKKALHFKQSDQTLKIAYLSANNMKLYSEKSFLGKRLLEQHSDSIALLYDLAFNEVRLYHYEQASKYLNQIILHPESITLQYNEYRGNGVQTVPYKAAAYNLLGFIKTEEADSKSALQMFKMALEVFPDYILAKENLKQSQLKVRS